ncbi:unnamed protein product [Heterobilharzia americana]|nr:unnamed protein product [Heterobilharzia americana]
MLTQNKYPSFHAATLHNGHLFSSSNNSQSKRTVSGVEVAEMKQVLHVRVTDAGVSRISKSINDDIHRAQTLPPHLRITSMLFSVGASNPAEIMVIKYEESSNIISLDKLGKTLKASMQEKSIESLNVGLNRVGKCNVQAEAHDTAETDG